MRLGSALALLGLAVSLASAAPLATDLPPALANLSRRATTAVKCSSTTTCSAAAYSIPNHAHYACNKARGVCTWSCNAGYAVLGDACAQVCATSSTCKNEVPANANRYCMSGFCSWRCRSGFLNTGTACAKSSTSSTTSSASSNSPSTTSPTATPTSSTCAVSTDCTGDVPNYANHYCLAGTCGWRCRTGYVSNGSTCIPTTAPTAITTVATSPSSSSQSSTSWILPSSTSSSASTSSSSSSSTSSSPIATCSTSSQCTNIIPSNANQYCNSGVCSWRCRAGFTSTGSSCISLSSTSSSASSTLTSTLTSSTLTSSTSTSTAPTSTFSWPAPNWWRPCSADADCTFFTPADTHNYCDSGSGSGFCSWRCDDGFVLGYGGNGCISSSPVPSAAPTAPALVPTLVRSYEGSTFFDAWDYFAEPDPTHGMVDYLSRSAAVAQSLTHVTSSGTAILQIDRTTALAPGEYRSSVRISSRDTYDAGSFVVLDLEHAPHGPSVWPAFWMIDVYEGINARNWGQPNVHTSDGCWRNASVPKTGDASNIGRSCSVNDGSGCAVRDLDPASYGAGFNAAGGGVFAVLFAETGISIWRWKRADIPLDVLAGSPRWAQWGAPVAVWDGSTCDTRTYFKKHRLTFDITTCGDWAGPASTWNSVASSGTVAAKYPTCADAVRDPAAFVEAYFVINYLKVYSV
ncbi:hypothetical protein JCM8208_007517 [Rhodotorula glutinis]